MCQILLKLNQYNGRNTHSKTDMFFYEQPIGNYDIVMNGNNMHFDTYVKIYHWYDCKYFILS